MDSTQPIRARASAIDQYRHALDLMREYTTGFAWSDDFRLKGNSSRDFRGVHNDLYNTQRLLLLIDFTRCASAITSLLQSAQPKMADDIATSANADVQDAFADASRCNRMTDLATWMAPLLETTKSTSYEDPTTEFAECLQAFSHHLAVFESIRDNLKGDHAISAQSLKGVPPMTIIFSKTASTGSSNEIRS